MKECVLCKTRYQKGSGVTFHKFPTDNTRLELWLKNIDKPCWRPKQYDYICSRHFSDDCFIKHNTCTTLKKCSIPTILCRSTSLKRSRSSSCDLQQSIDLKKVRSDLESSPSKHEKMFALILCVPGSRMVKSTPSVSGKVTIKVKRRLIMEQNDTNLSCQTCRSASCNPQQSFASQKIRSLTEVQDNVRHDHCYENNKSSEKILQRIKKSLSESRARVRVLSQHVKRLSKSKSQSKKHLFAKDMVMSPENNKNRKFIN